MWGVGRETRIRQRVQGHHCVATSYTDTHIILLAPLFMIPSVVVAAGLLLLLLRPSVLKTGTRFTVKYNSRRRGRKREGKNVVVKSGTRSGDELTNVSPAITPNLLHDISCLLIGCSYQPFVVRHVVGSIGIVVREEGKLEQLGLRRF